MCPRALHLLLSPGRLERLWPSSQLLVPEKGRFPWRSSSGHKQPSAVVSEAQGRFLFLGDPWAKDCSLDIRDAQWRDTGTYIFRLVRGSTVRYSYALNLLSVRVTGKDGVKGRTHIQGS